MTRSGGSTGAASTPKRVPPAAVWLTAIVMIGLGVRVAWVLHVQPVPFGDTYWYANVAGNLLHGNGFAANNSNQFIAPPDVPHPTAYYPPAYPVALAALWRVVGVSVRSAELFNAVLGALTIPLVYGLGLKIYSRRAGLLAAGLFAVFPNAIAWLPLLLSETLFTLLFAAALWALVSFGPQPPLRPAAAVIGFGLVTGVAALTRGEGLVLLPAALIFWLARDGWQAGLWQGTLAVLVTLLVVAPWTARNWIVLGSPIPIASNAGINLRIGHSPQASGTAMFLGEPIDGVPGFRSLEQPDWEVRADRVYRERAARYAATHPARELALARSKVQHLYESEDEMALALSALGGTGVRPDRLNDAFRPTLAWAWYCALLAAVTSAPFWVRATPERLLLPLIFALWTAFHVAFFGLARFHLPLLPLVLLAAACGLSAACRSVRRFAPGARRGATTAV